MRLTEPQIHQIIQAFRPFMHDGPVELRLYSSRVDNHQESGDIDLLILAEQADFADNLMSLKNVILANLKKQFGDHKIHLKIAAKEDVPHDPFLKMILPKSILLYRFG